MELEHCTGQCAKCTSPKRQCGPSGDFIPKGICSTEIYPEVIERAMEKYKDPAIAEFAQQSMRQSDAAHGKLQGNDVRFPCKCRIQETVEFARRMRYKKLGLAFCGAVHPEATKLSKILEAQGFEVVSVCCKVGKKNKECIGVSQEEQDAINIHTNMCNPIVQAEIMNYEKTDMNILLGLCVGHDALFLKYSAAMCTVLAVKDRLLCNNPMGALYLADWHYKRLYNPDAFDKFDEHGNKINGTIQESTN